MTYIYNLCIQQNILPSALKAAKVIPLPKIKDLTDRNTFRPISLLSVLSKPLEKHIHKHLVLFTEDYNLFHPFHSGFRRHHLCHTALIRLCDTRLSAINKTQVAGAVFLDLKKAFDPVDHSILLKQIVRLSPAPQLHHQYNSYITSTTATSPAQQRPSPVQQLHHQYNSYITSTIATSPVQ